jgi:enoyl-CoA hydratase/carnithine racemase
MTHTVETSWINELIAVVTFTDVERRNELCWAAIDELGQALTDAREAGARAVILASSLPGHWLQHAWLKDLANGVEGLEQSGTGAGWFSVLTELGHEDVVSIAAISGDCSGGGAEIGWACDLRVAEQQARFAQPEVNIGLTTGIGGCSRLARLAGRSIAVEMVMTGRPLSAPRLYQLGAINHLVEAGQAVATATELARDIVTKSPAALKGLKKILAFNDDAPLAEALEHEQAVFQSVVVTDEAVAAMRAVQEQYDQGVSIAQINNYNKWHEK